MPTHPGHIPYYGLQDFAPQSALQVTGTVGVSGLTISASLGSNVTVTNFPDPQQVTGSVGVSNFPSQFSTYGQVFVDVTGSTGLHVAAPPSSPVWVTGSVFVDNQSGGGGGSVTQGTVPWVVAGSANVYTSGPQAVSGSVAVSSLPPGQVYTSGPQGVTGSVNTYTSGLQGISGSVSVSSLPPGQVYTSGPQGVTGSVNTYTSGLQGVSGSVAITSLPAVQTYTSAPQGVTGSVAVYTQGAQLVSGTVTSNVTVTGSTGLMVAAPVSAPLWVTGSVFVDNQSSGGGSNVTVAGWSTNVTGTFALPGCTDAALSSFTGSLVSAQFLAANQNRLGATFQNITGSTDTCYLRLGASSAASTAGNHTVALYPGTYYELPFNWKGAVQGAWDGNTAGDGVSVTELAVS